MLTVSEPLFALNPLIEYSFFVGDVFVGVTPEPVTPAILNLLFDDKLFWNVIASEPILKSTEPLLECKSPVIVPPSFAVNVALVLLKFKPTPSNFFTGDTEILSVNTEPNSSEPLNSYVVFPVPNG